MTKTCGGIFVSKMSLQHLLQNSHKTAFR